MGTTGKVGGTALKYLKEAKANVRAVLRNESKSADVLAAGIYIPLPIYPTYHYYSIPTSIIFTIK